MAHPTLATDDFGTVNVVETPTSPSSAFTLSRFEFEAGTKGNEGTKILMVEWDAAAAATAAAAASLRGGNTAAAAAKDGQEENNNKAAQAQAAEQAASLDDWEVTWDGKEALAVLPIRDAATPPATCRIYFLLPPKAPIPTLITISPKTTTTTTTTTAAGAPAAPPAAAADLHTKPLPAIFPDGLVSEDKGTRGVLHTIWAKSRLTQLEAEIVAEMKANGEGVGLEMALQERQWIVDHFGLQIDTSSAEAIPLAPHVAEAAPPSSPRSPIGGRLGEKLRGLKLATSPAELAAVKSSQAQAKKITALAPESAPAGFPGGIASLSAVMQTGQSAPERSHDTEEDLFALPMSPRSPEMAMSPFSLLKS